MLYCPRYSYTTSALLYCNTSEVGVNTLQTNMECMMLKSKIARPLDQTEKEWTNTNTMLTDDNYDKENQIYGYTDCASD